MDIHKDLKKQNSFKVPENYFDELPASIMDAVHSSSTSQPTFALRPSVSFAALAVLSGFVFFLIYFSQPQKPVSEDYTLTEGDIQHVIDNSSLYNIDEASIDDEYFSSIDGSSFGEMGPSEEEIQSYLEENINTNNLIIEL